MEPPRHRVLIATGLALVLSATGLWVFALPTQWRRPPDDAFRSEVVRVETGQGVQASVVTRGEAVVIWTEGLRPIEADGR